MSKLSAIAADDVIVMSGEMAEEASGKSPSDPHGVGFDRFRPKAQR